MLAPTTLRGQIVDVHARRVYPGAITIEGGRIAAIQPDPGAGPTFLMPGFIDAHVHIESSMLAPTEFARRAVVYGTVATVSDPHEIGNVLGVAGVDWMLANARLTPLKIAFGAPACVPATVFETAGASITAQEVDQLLADPNIRYLSEMMNFPGVLGGDPECLAKIASAAKRGKPVDGHAPGLRGLDALRYFSAGISTDHECFTKEEALDKIAAGCKIAIREGSAARNFDALWTLLLEHPDRCMLCSDDKHPDELLLGHIDAVVRRALERGADLFDVLRAACVNPVEHYALPVGLLREGEPADLIEVDSLTAPRVLRTWIDGVLVAERGESLLPTVPIEPVNHFVSRTVGEVELMVEPQGDAPLRVIEAIDGQLVTDAVSMAPKLADDLVVSDPDRDLLKLVVVNRYRPAEPAVAFIKNFGLRRGAIAGSVAHDSHNVIAVGVGDGDLADAINLVLQGDGGLSAACRADGVRELLPLPIAGLMATGTCEEVAAAYTQLDSLAKAWGSPLRAPYMTLSFMALTVIPALKLSDLGLFDGERFEFTELFG